MSEYDEIMGYKDGNPSLGTCERCGAENEDLRHGGCFVCGMLEDPESTADEVDDGVEALLERNWTVRRWEVARAARGFCVVPEANERALRREFIVEAAFRKQGKWWRRAWRKMSLPATTVGVAVPIVVLLRLLGLGWWMAVVGGTTAVLYNYTISIVALRYIRRKGDVAGTMLRLCGAPCDLCGDTRGVTIACSCGHEGHSPCPVCRQRETRKSIFPMAHGQA